MGRFNLTKFNIEPFNRDTQSTFLIYSTGTDSDLSGGTTNKALSETSVTEGYTTTTIGNETKTHYLFSSDEKPWNDEWEQGQFTIKFNVLAPYMSIPKIHCKVRVCRVSSTGTLLDNTDYTDEQALVSETLNSLTFNIPTKTWGTTSCSDRIRVDIVMRGHDWAIPPNGDYRLYYGSTTPFLTHSIRWNDKVTASTAASSAVSGALSFDCVLSGTVSAVSSLPDVTLSRTMGITGTVSGASSVTGSIGLIFGLVSSVSAISDVSSSITVEIIIIGLIGGASSLTSSLSIDQSIVTTVSASSNVDGTLDVILAVSLTGTITAITTFSGDFDKQPTFSATVDAVSAINGQFYAIWLTGSYTSMSDHIALSWEVW